MTNYVRVETITKQLIMALFDTLKKKRKTSQNKNLGPTFLENKVEQITNPKKLHSHEWKRGLKTESGGTFFKIKYYGQRQSKHKNLIVQTKFAPSKIYAVDVSNNEAFLLFDGCIHGYNAMFCDKYTKQQIENRSADKIYTSENGDNEFQIIISTYNRIDYDDEFSEQVDAHGKLELTSKVKIDFDEVKRNGFDGLQIWGINKAGNKIEIISEELA